MTVRPSVDSVTANMCIQGSVKEGDVLQHVLCMSQGGSDSTGAERQKGWCTVARAMYVSECYGRDSREAERQHLTVGGRLYLIGHILEKFFDYKE